MNDNYETIMQEAERVYAAVIAHSQSNATGDMLCPLCHNPIDIVKRPRRQTFAGWEDACIQFQCDTCGIGGEASNEAFSRAVERRHREGK